jgi:hypothetical protein
MDAEELVESLSREDLQAILRCSSEDPSGPTEQLQSMILAKAKSLPWKGLLTCVPKESLQRICSARGLRSDLIKDELIDQIVRLKTEAPKQRNPLRDLFSFWSR